jgi:uncharacterized membrane protein
LANSLALSYDCTVVSLAAMLGKISYLLLERCSHVVVHMSSSHETEPVQSVMVAAAKFMPPLALASVVVLIRRQMVNRLNGFPTMA